MKNIWPLFLQVLLLSILFLLFLEPQFIFSLCPYTSYFLFLIFSHFYFCASVWIYSKAYFQFIQLWCYTHQLSSSFYLFLFFHYRISFFFIIVIHYGISILIFLWFLLLYWYPSSCSFIFEHINYRYLVFMYNNSNFLITYRYVYTTYFSLVLGSSLIFVYPWLF